MSAEAAALGSRFPDSGRGVPSHTDVGSGDFVASSAGRVLEVRAASPQREGIRVTDETGLGHGSPTDGGGDETEGLRVLYAEDHPEMQRAVARLLRAAGASVTIARDGLEATERALAENFDLILMDLRMPGMDGLDAARALRAADYRVPIIAVTSDATPAVRANALAAGFDAVLPKPFELSDLISAIQLVRRRGAQRRGSSSP